MKCPNCNFENSDDTKFCCGCGKLIPRCPTCGKVLTSRDRFCVHDGTRLPDELLMLVPEVVLNDDGFEQVDVLSAGGAVVQRALHEEIEVPVKPAYAASCLRCGSPVWQGESYCVSCRNAVEEKAHVCASCGMPCDPGEEYCSYCRPTNSVPVENMDYIPYDTYDRPRKPEKKKRGSAFTVILVVLLLLLIGAAAVLVAAEFDLIDLPDIFTSDDSGSGRDRDRDSDDDDNNDGNGDGVAVGDGTVAPGGDDNGGDSTNNGGDDAVSGTVPAETTAPTTQPTTAATEPTTQPSESTQTKLEYFMENCDSVYFERSDIEGFTKDECYYARNACYAQAGRKFKNKELQAYFEQYYWYSPSYEPTYFDEHDDELMNKYENANRKLISAYEKEKGYK